MGFIIVFAYGAKVGNKIYIPHSPMLEIMMFNRVKLYSTT